MSRFLIEVTDSERELICVLFQDRIFQDYFDGYSYRELSNLFRIPKADLKTILREEVGNERMSKVIGAASERRKTNRNVFKNGTYERLEKL